jgi:hypothetical protein
VIPSTTAVVTMKVALAAPPGTVTLAGTAADVLVLVSVTTEPPSGATPLRVTVPVEVAPPTRLDGASTSDDTAGGLMVSDADCVAPP